MKSTTAETVKMTATFDDGSKLEVALADMPSDKDALKGVALAVMRLRDNVERLDFETDTGRHLLTVGEERA